MEGLKGKAKEDFIKWFYERDYSGWFNTDTISDLLYDGEIKFFNLPLPMKWGVYQDFFISNGIVLEEEFTFFTEEDNLFDHCDDICHPCKSVLTAQIDAIEKACEIYNNK